MFRLSAGNVPPFGQAGGGSAHRIFVSPEGHEQFCGVADGYDIPEVDVAFVAGAGEWIQKLMVVDTATRCFSNGRFPG